MFRVLVVDDSTVDRFLVEATLRRHGMCQLLSASDGQEALEACRGNEIDVVVTDLRMPEMDGVEFTVQAAEEFPDLPVILLASVPGSEALAVEALCSGAAGYVVKDQAAKVLPGTLDDTMSVLDGSIHDGETNARPQNDNEIILRAGRSTEDELGDHRRQVTQMIALDAHRWSRPSCTRLLLSTVGILEWVVSSLGEADGDARMALTFHDSTAEIQGIGISATAMAALVEAVASPQTSDLMSVWPPGAVLARVIGKWQLDDNAFSCTLPLISKTS